MLVHLILLVILCMLLWLSNTVILQYLSKFNSFKKIEINRDATFDEDATFCKSKNNSSEEIQEEDPKAPRGLEPEDEVIHEDHDELEPQRPEDLHKEVI